MKHLKCRQGCRLSFRSTFLVVLALIWIVGVSDGIAQATMGPPPGYIDTSGYLCPRSGDSVLVWANGTDSIWATPAGLRLGDNANYITIPLIDGSSGQVLKTDGAGTLTWSTDLQGGGSGGWADDGVYVRLESVGDSVGIGTTTPGEKLTVKGNIAIGDTATGDHDGYLYFGDDALWKYHYLQFDDGNDRFHLSNDLDINGGITGVDIMTVSAAFSSPLITAKYLYSATADSIIVTDTLWCRKHIEAEEGINVTGNIIVSGNVDGVNVSAIPSTYEVQLNNETGLYAVLSDVADFVQPGDAAHDGFSDFVANEHIDWTGASAGTVHATNYVDNTTADADSLRGKPMSQAARTDNYIWKWDAALDSFMLEADQTGAGSGSEDTLIIPIGAVNYSILNNYLRLRFGNGIVVQGGDSSGVDTIVVRVDTGWLETLIDSSDVDFADSALGAQRATTDLAGNVITTTYRTVAADIDPDDIDGDVVNNNRLDSNVVAAVVEKAHYDIDGDLINISDYFHKDGSVSATGAFAMGDNDMVNLDSLDADTVITKYLGATTFRLGATDSLTDINGTGLAIVAHILGVDLTWLDGIIDTSDAEFADSALACLRAWYLGDNITPIKDTLQSSGTEIVVKDDLKVTGNLEVGGGAANGAIEADTVLGNVYGRFDKLAVGDSSAVAFTFPQVDATAADQVMVSNASGVLSWTDQTGAGGSGDDIKIDSAGTAVDVGASVLKAGQGLSFDTLKQGVTDTVYIYGKDATTSTKGVASFATANFAVTNGAVTVKVDGISASEIVAGAVGTSEIATDGVAAAEIAANAVGNSEMADNAIGNAEMADDAIGAAEMADADHGEISWSAGIASIDTAVVDTSNLLDVEMQEYIRDYAGALVGITGTGITIAHVDIADSITAVVDLDLRQHTLDTTEVLKIISDNMSGDGTISAAGVLAISADAIGTAEINNGTISEVDLKVVNAAVDEDIFTYEATTGDFEWQTPAELGILYEASANVDTAAWNAAEGKFPDSGSWNMLPKAIFKMGLLIGNASDSGVADSNTATRGYVEKMIEDSLNEYSLTTAIAAAYQPLEATLTDIADGTIAENLVNTAYPWADNEVASSGNWNTAYDSSQHDYLRSNEEAADADTAGTKLRAGLNTRLKLSGGTMTGSLVGVDSLDLDSGLYISDDITITGTIDGIDLSVFAATLDDDAEVLTEAEAGDSLTHYLHEDSVEQAFGSIPFDRNYFDTTGDSIKVKYADSSGAIPSTEDFHIWGNAYISGQLDQQQHKHRIDSTVAYCTWPDDYLKLPQFYSAWDVDDSAKCVNSDSSHALHPAIIYAPEGKWKHTASGAGVDTVSRWNTHWLGYGPICVSENDENPHIAVKDEGGDWHEFYVGPDSVPGVGYYDSTLHNPVYDRNGTVYFNGDAWTAASHTWATCTHLSDQDLFLDLDGNMYMPFRGTHEIGGSDSNWIAIGRTSDGLNWDSAVVILAEGLCSDRGDGDGFWDFISPSFLNDTNNTFEMWCVEKAGDGTDATTWIVKFEAPQWDSAWRLVDTCTYNSFNANGRPWHLKVLRHGVDELVALVIEADTSGATDNLILVLATSYDDGMTWNATDSLLAKGSDSWNDVRPYRADAIWVNKGGYEVLEAYISSSGTAHGWATCRTDIRFMSTVDTTDGALTTYVTGVANDTGDVIRAEIKGEIRDTIDIITNLDSGNVSANGISMTDINWPSYWVDFDNVHVVKDSTDSVEVSFPVLVPSTHQNWLLTCSTYAATTRSETLTVIGVVPYAGNLDTFCICYRVSTGSEITQRTMYGPDLSDGTNLADSLYNYADATDLTSTAWTVDTTAFTNPQKVTCSGTERIALQLIIKLDAVNDRLHLGWVSMQLSR